VLSLIVALPLAAAMLATLRWCWNGDAWGVATLLLLCIVWLRVDKAFEGPHVVRVSTSHSLVLSDLFAIVVGACGVVGWLGQRLQIDRRRRSELRDQAPVGDRD